MTHFPHHHLQRSAHSEAKAFAAGRQNINRDILWGQPVFKAPVLTNPFAPAQPDWGQTPGFVKRSNGAAFDPLPFTAARVTRRSPQA